MYQLSNAGLNNEYKKIQIIKSEDKSMNPIKSLLTIKYIRVKKLTEIIDKKRLADKNLSLLALYFSKETLRDPDVKAKVEIVYIILCHEV